MMHDGGLFDTYYHLRKKALEVEIAVKSKYHYGPKNGGTGSLMCPKKRKKNRKKRTTK